MGLRSQRRKEQSVASVMEIQHKLEISLKFKVGEANGWRSWGGGNSGGLIVLSWSLGLDSL